MSARGPRPTSGPRVDGDARLVRLLATADDASDAAFVRATCADVLSLARRLLPDAREADAAVRAAYAAAFDDRAAFACEPPAARLRRLALRACLRTLRSRADDAAPDLAALRPAFGADGEPSSRPRPWPAVDAAPDAFPSHAFVRGAVAALPEPYRVAFLLRDVEGLGAEEAAEGLGLPPAVVRRRLGVARRVLRTVLDAATAPSVR